MAPPADTTLSSTPVWTGDDAWVISEEALGVVGGSSDRSGVAIGRLLNAFLLSDGSLVVADEQSSTVHWFDENHMLRASFGRPGEGPGEFSDLTAAFRTAGDTLVLVDRPLRRVTVVSSEPELVGTEPLDFGPWETYPHGGDRQLRAIARGALADRTIVGITTTTFMGAEGVIQDSLWILLDPPGDVPARRLGPFVGREYWRADNSISALPLGRVSFYAIGSSTVVLGTGKPALLDLVSTDGGASRTFGIDEPLRPATPELVDETMARLIERQVASQRARRAERLEAMEYPETVPAFSGVWLDDAGYVWVERYRIEDRLPSFEVFSPDGAWQGTVSLPVDAELLWVGLDAVVVTREDEFDVDEVLVLPLSRGVRK